MDIVLSYATSGDRDLEPNVFHFFKELYLTGRTVAIPTATALAVVSHLLPVLKEVKDTSGWYILWALSCPLFNSNGTAFLDELEKLSWCDDVLNLNWQLRRIAMDRYEEVIGIRFISEFVDGSHSRMHMVFKYPDLIRAIVLAVETETTMPADKVDHLDSIIATRALQSLVQAIKQDFIGSLNDVRYDYLEVLLRYGGLRALCLALDYAVQSNNSSVDLRDGENAHLAKSALALKAVLTILDEWQPTHLDSELYTLDRNARFRMNVTVHNLLTLRLAKGTRGVTGSFAFVYALYVLHKAGDEGLQEFLLFKLPREPDGDCLLVHLLALVRKLEETASQVKLREALRDMTINLSTVAEVLDRHYPLVLDKSRRCAHPDCNILDDANLGSMKKCGRCKTVYYCSAAHQQEHWPVHKRECKKAEP